MKIFIFSVFIIINTQAAFAQKNDTLELVRKVREKAKKQYENIQTLGFSGRSVFYDYVGSKIVNLSTIRDYEDCYFDGFWKKPDSLQIVVKAFRTVDPDAPNRQNFWANFPLPDPMKYTFFNSITPLEYTDITIVDPGNGKKRSVLLRSQWPVFPFAEGADSLYNYEVISEIGMNGRRIVELRVSTKSDDIPGVSGIFRIDADEKDIVGSDYTFNEAADLMKKFLAAEGFPAIARIFIDFDASYRVFTKKVLINGVYWLPEKIVEDVNIKSLSSKISFRREIKYSSYFVNMKPLETALDIEPDGEFIEEVLFRRDPGLEIKVFNTMEDSTKLTKAEENRIISAVEDKFLQMEQSIVRMDLEQKGRKLVHLAKGFGSNFLLHNRVEGVRLFYNIGFTGFLTPNSSLDIGGGYGIKDKRLKGDLRYRKFFGKKRRLLLEGNIFEDTGHNDSEIDIPTILNTYSSIIFKLDHRDYYYRSGFSLGIDYDFNENLKLRMAVISQTEKSALNNTRFGLLDWKTPFRLNPGIIPGKYNGITTDLTLITFNTTFRVNAEYTDKTIFKSDFTYGKVRSDLRYIYKPDYTSTFIFTLSGGISTGKLPPQRWFDIGGKVLMEYYGRLRGIGLKAFTGDRKVSGLLEYSFCYGDVWDSVKKRPWWEYTFRMTKFTVWAGQAWSELSDRSGINTNRINTPMVTTNGIYREYGLSIGDRFNLCRFDLIANNSSERSYILSFNFWR